MKRFGLSFRNRDYLPRKCSEFTLQNNQDSEQVTKNSRSPIVNKFGKSGRSQAHGRSTNTNYFATYKRIFETITKTTVEEINQNIGHLHSSLRLEDLQATNYTADDLYLMRARFHCAAFEGQLDRFCVCCESRSNAEIRLRCDAIEVAALVFQDYHTVEFGLRPCHWSALLAAKGFLEQHGIDLDDVQLECLKAQRLIAFAQAQQLEFERHNTRSAHVGAIDQHPDVQCRQDDTSVECRIKYPDSVSDSGIESGCSSLSVRSSSLDSLERIEGSPNLTSDTSPATQADPGVSSLTLSSDWDTATEMQSPDQAATGEAVLITNISLTADQPQVDNTSDDDQASWYDFNNANDLELEDGTFELRYTEASKSGTVCQRSCKRRTNRKCQRRHRSSVRATKSLRKHATAPERNCDQLQISPQASFPMADGIFYQFQEVKKIPEPLFETSQLVKDKLSAFRDDCMTNADAKRNVEILSQYPECWQRDFELRCLDLHMFYNQREQHERQQATLSIGQIRSQELHGITNERVRLSCGKVTPSEHTELALEKAEKISVHVDKIASLRTSLAALFDHTIQQFHHSWHLVTDDRVSLLDRLKKRLNSIGGRFLTQGHQKRLGAGFRGIFISLQQGHIAETRRHQAHMIEQFSQVDETRRTKMIQIGDAVALVKSEQVDGVSQDRVQFFASEDCSHDCLGPDQKCLTWTEYPGSATAAADDRQP